MQAFGGMIETGIGYGLTSAGLLPLGIPLMLHGFDNYLAGSHATTFGKPQSTFTERFLQRAGASHEMSGFINSGLGMVAGAEGFNSLQRILQYGKGIGSAFQQFSPKSKSFSTLKFLKIENKSFESQMAPKEALRYNKYWMKHAPEQ